MARSPRFAPAWASLAEAYDYAEGFVAADTAQAFRRAEQAARTAIQLDGSLASGHHMLALQLKNVLWDFQGADAAYRRALALDSKVSIATVYRTVRLLEENGILERRDFGGGRARYDLADRGHHHHLIDVDTGKVIEFADEEFEALARIMARRLGFDLVGQRLELFGRKAEPEPPRPEARPRARRGAS